MKGWPAQAYLEELGGGRLREEEALLAGVFSRRGVPVTLFTAKRLQRRQLALDRRCFLAGDGAAVVAALRQLDIEPPAPLDYPEALRPYLRRPLWQSTVGQLVSDLTCGRGPVFAKPAIRAKRFTGRVFEGHEDLYFLHGTSRHERVWCSPPVAWTSEWRAYVLGERVLDLCHYAGRRESAPDDGALWNMVSAFHRSGSAPAGFALDLGVLEDGATALVEVNDAMALGAYGIQPDAYADLLLARWAELVLP